MDKIHEGWLTKSPPEWKRHMNLFKVKKWRRRYFVLYSPPTSCINPGACPAQLCYYENESLSKECGKIDLTNCEEILSQLETDDHKHVMALSTVCKNQTRTYHLASDSEEDLEVWVDKISFVLSLSGEEFIEISLDEREEHETGKFPLKSIKQEDKTKKDKKVRNKPSAVTLRRSSSAVSKSSTNLYQSAFNLSKPLPMSTSSNIGTIRKYKSKVDDFHLADNSAFAAVDYPYNENMHSTTVINKLLSKPSFLDKIKQLKGNSRRPSCPLIIQPSCFSEESLNGTPTLLRPNIPRPSQNLCFQGSTSSSIFSFAPDYKLSDFPLPSSISTPPVYYQTSMKNEVTECTLRFECKKSLSSEPPPLPPKVRAADSGLPDETSVSGAVPIYDVPAHSYGSYQEELEDKPEEDFIEFELCSRFEGVCLSVVDEREDEGLENDCNPIVKEIINPLPLPLPERKDSCEDKSHKNSWDYDYDTLPFLKQHSNNDGEALNRLSEDVSYNSDNENTYDRLPWNGEMERNDWFHEPPPLPERRKKRLSGNIFGDFEGVIDDLYDRIANSDDKDNEFGDIFVHEACRGSMMGYELPVKMTIDHSKKKFLSITEKKSKSLEDLCRSERSSQLFGSLDFNFDYLSNNTPKTSTDILGEEIFIRATFKTRSFKRKSTDCKDKILVADSDSSLRSTSPASNNDDENSVPNNNFS